MPLNWNFPAKTGPGKREQVKLRKGQAVLRAKVGSHKLQVEGPGGMLVFLCELVVKKDRITTITVLERPPRCQCRNTAGTDPAANRTCVS